MKRKFSIALALALLLALTLTSLASAADPSAQVLFTTDAPCAVTVNLFSYTNPAGQPGIPPANTMTPFTLDTYPSTSVVFFYPASVVCNGTAYYLLSVSPSGQFTSGAADTITTVTGHYSVPVPTDATPPVWTVPADFNVEATGPTGAVVNYTVSVSDPDDAVSSQSCSPASGAAFAFGITTVNCAATDTHGNTGMAAFHVNVVDTTPPALTVPADMIVTALNASGATVNFVASANDLVDGVVTVNCSPASGSTFPVGVTTVNCSAADSRRNIANRSFTVSVQYYLPAGIKCGGIMGHQILQPINADGSSVFKRGSTVPAKFRVCGADGRAITDPGVVTNFRLVQIISNGSVKNVDEAVISTSAHDVFRAGAQQWIFNINTKNLTAGKTYVYLITLNDGSTIQFKFTLK